jgi:glycosyltransferase involved in cell wall biosynthesis
VTSGEDGLLLPPHDDAAMARAALDLLADDPRRAAMAERARDSATRKFGVSKVVPMYEDVYRRAAAG